MMRTTFSNHIHKPEYKPIPVDINYCNVNHPGFLEKVQATHFLRQHYIQLLVWTRGGLAKVDEKAWEEANKYFKVSNPAPNAVRVFDRYDNIGWEGKWYTVIGLKRVREGELWRDMEGARSFSNKRTHTVAILATNMNETKLALVTDLVR
jgi:hypothetical protein